eukprot:CAMPEP_0113511140 /NCGR_PEP_ID=MMETSP0014_2-20120614/38537_1 /TAXON_ID=2857 /ORGANISM="Nitzschia sp." /LENGTH=432 /DNA_ID=CAMNT_0000407191 /DNA_START=126 /DNA_END=1424 /DNA_ORIENTATION=+ /assembly_acc=CAM_ASM_000159
MKSFVVRSSSNSVISKNPLSSWSRCATNVCGVSSSYDKVHQTRRDFHSSSSSSSSSSSDRIITTQWADPAMRQYKFWNRETTEKERFSYLLEISPESIQKEALILSLAAPDDDANTSLHSGPLPMGSKVLGVGESLSDFEAHRDAKPNVLFVSPSCPRAMAQVPLVLAAFPSIEWMHVRSAGIDFVASDELTEFKDRVLVTNAKGSFSSSLAEYVLLSCSYFAKDIARLMAQQQQKQWEKFDIQDLRGSTLGVIGYGDIGRATAKLATMYGMRIVALRRHPFLSKHDPLCDVVYGTSKSSLNQLMSESDYIVCSAPSTVETRGMVNADAFDHVKEGAVFINLGRGPVVDERALIKALKSGRLRGAALDVFEEEPLAKDNELWDLPNVLISPHNMDQTSRFMDEATEFFVRENLPRFLCGEDLLNPVDVELGY